MIDTTPGSASTLNLAYTETAVPSKTAVPSVVARAQAGDHQAFTELHSLYKCRVYKICLRMVHNVALAQDLSQDSFLQLHRKIGTFQGNSAFSTWLHRLTVNVVLMHLRRKGLPLVPLEYVAPDAHEEHYGERFGTIDRYLAGAIDRAAIDRAANILPAGYRTIFYLHDVKGFEHHEIASRLRCSIGNSKSQLHKARRNLRDALMARQEAEARNTSGRQHQRSATLPGASAGSAVAR